MPSKLYQQDIVDRLVVLVTSVYGHWHVRLSASFSVIHAHASLVVFVYSGPIAIKDVGVQFFALFVVGPSFENYMFKFRC